MSTQPGPRPARPAPTSRSRPTPGRISRQQRRLLKKAKASAKAAKLAAKCRTGRRDRRRPVTVFVRSLDLDYGSLSSRRSWPDLIIAYVDWIEDRACHHSDEEQLAGPCGSRMELAARVRRAIWRHRNTGMALKDLCKACEADPLPKRKPGALDPSDTCRGCVYSYPRPTGPDIALLEVFRPRPADQIRTRALLAGQKPPPILPDLDARRRDIRRHAGSREPDWSNYPDGAYPLPGELRLARREARMEHLEYDTKGKDRWPHLRPLKKH